MAEINANEKPKIVALNKVDKLMSTAAIKRLERSFNNSISISALHGLGIEGLLKKIAANFKGEIMSIKVTIPYNQMKLVDLLYKEGRVINRVDKASGITLVAEVSKRINDIIKNKL